MIILVEYFDKMVMMNKLNNNGVVVLKTEGEKNSVDVRFGDEIVWLFYKSRSTINEHIINVFAESESKEKNTVRKIGISDFSTKPTNFYNLDGIISVSGTEYKKHQQKTLSEVEKSFFDTIQGILCADKSDAIVRYTLAEDNKQIFASKYMLYLPTEQELKNEIYAVVNK